MKRRIATMVALALLLLAGCATSPRTPSAEPPPPPTAPPVGLEPAPPPPPPVREGPAWVTLAVRAGDGPWEPARNGATYPRARLALRFDLHGPVDEAALRQRLPEGARVEKPADDRLEAVWETPPPALEFLAVGEPPGRMIRFYTGEPPRLVALDPATGQERILGELPADMEWAYLSPDGSAALLVYMPDPGDFRTLHLDLKSGAQQETPLGHQPFYGLVSWYGGQVVKTVYQQVQFWDPQRGGALERVDTGARYWSAVSPEGRYLAGLHYETVIAGSITPVTVVIFDLKERREQRFPEAVRIYVGPHHLEQYMEWSPDSRALLMQDHLGHKQTRTLRLHRSTGEITAVDEELVAPPYGPWIAGPDGWSYRAAPWEELRVMSSAGQEQQWDRGYPVGWLPSGELLVIRWENVTHRRVWGM